MVAALLVSGPSRAEDVPWRLLILYGQAFLPPDQGFAEVGGLGAGRDFNLGGRWGLGVEVFPLLRFNETASFSPRRRLGTTAFAAGFPLSFTAGPREAQWAVRIEGSIGPFWSGDPVPVHGTRWNFIDEVGPRLLLRLSSGLRLGVGYRFLHISNGNIRRPNPGLSFHTVVLTLEGR